MKAGYLLASEGCMPTAMGARVRLSYERITVTDRRFSHPSECNGDLDEAAGAADAIARLFFDNWEEERFDNLQLSSVVDNVQPSRGLQEKWLGHRWSWPISFAHKTIAISAPAAAGGR